MNQPLRYETNIDAFQGPLDLLLHLIKETKLDIHDIKIAEITKQYLNYLKAMEKMHLEIASEYLVMAANLMLIKSKKLLPKVEVDIEDAYEEDPEEALMRRLIEYQMYKESVDEFRKLEEERGQFYTKPAIDFSAYIDDHLKLDTDYDTSALMLAFEKLLRRQQLEKPIPTKIMAEKVTVSEQMTTIKARLMFQKRVTFTELVDTYDKAYVVVTFLALLEMTKSGEIILLQTASEGEIEVIAKGGLT
ncbi:MAG: segregation/condensation protein A [Defluviitaleaceae bacterium]|nr:segregation/condensation protein A [Defluviitaleaceae bacterium]